MADYDAGEVTERERLAAERLKEIARFNRNSVDVQLDNQLANYDQADRQNASLRDAQLKQASRKAEADRFEAQRNLRNAMLGLYGTMGNMAMNSSTLDNVNSMLADRNDADNSIYWQQLQENRDSINNAFQESYNQNQVAKNEAANTASKAIRDIEGDLSANLNNINPNLYVSPGTGEAMLNAWNPGPLSKMVPDALSRLSGYIMPGITNKR